jgi:hypothetical protein
VQLDKLHALPVQETLMVDRQTRLSTEQKALEINLDDQKYGTIVEIGAGQEVARQFFSAGAAAGTIAKTSSAYDMQISDAIYGKTERYVSLERLRQMMDHEFDLLLERLAHRRSRNTTYFTYAATVTAKSYREASECHGWIGLKVQMYPGAAASEFVLHVRMLDDTNALQSEALGILGVNLMYGAFYSALKPKALIESLLDNLEQDRLEVDLINFSGPYFEEIDNRLMNLQLVRSWCCRAVMFNANSQPVVPATELRKKNTVVLRGSFRPPTKVHVDMMEGALRQFIEVEGIHRDNVTTMAEITMADIAADKDQADEEFLNRVDLLNDLGYTVLVSDYLRFFRLRSWIRRYTSNTIGIVLSVLDFNQLFDPRFYEGLEGGILEAMGKLFSDNTHVYVYPARIGDRLVALDNVEVAPDLVHLLKHLVANNAMVPAAYYNEDHLGIIPAEVLESIASGRPGWEESVPVQVVDTIKTRRLYGFME